MKTKLTRKQLLGNLLLFSGLIAIIFSLLWQRDKIRGTYGSNPQRACARCLVLQIGCMCALCTQ